MRRQATLKRLAESGVKFAGWVGDLAAGLKANLREETS
jgi:hypothetical protein